MRQKGMGMTKKQNNKTEVTQVLVAVGSLLSGFEFYGPFPAPKTDHQKDLIRAEVILKRGHFGKNDPPFLMMPLRDSERKDGGDWFILIGTVVQGFSIYGPFRSKRAAEQFVGPACTIATAVRSACVFTAPKEG
jgi:hypothetical protein